MKNPLPQFRCVLFISRISLEVGNNLFIAISIYYLLQEIKEMKKKEAALVKWENEIGSKEQAFKTAEEVLTLNVLI